jgi:ATP-dependent RNA helicase RhlB
MKKFILSAGRKIKQLALAGQRRYGRMLGKNRPEMGEDTSAPGTATPESLPLSAAGPPATAAAKGSRGGGKGRKTRAAEQSRSEPEWSLDQFVVEPAEGKSRFHDFGIPLPVMRAVAEQGFSYCTAIQEKTLADVLAGNDLVGKANTGTGKTAVFLIAMISRLLAEDRPMKKPGRGTVRGLVLAPTRELVMQITKDGIGLSTYCDISIQAVYGGVDYQKQMQRLQEQPCDVVVATPGRLIDFLGKGVVDLSACKILVLDEADRMLDMGFIPDVRRIVGRLPARKERQTMLFSATVPGDVQRLAAQWCVEPKVVEAEPEQVAVDSVEQIVYLTTTEEKYTVLYNLLRVHENDRILVFTNMKSEARRLAERLERNGIECLLLSGDVAQNKRANRLESFREGRVKVLVATDVAGRGIHIEGITFVVNYTLPYEPEDYVHRIGRTGRAGANGKSVSFACEEGAFYLPAIEEYIDRKLECLVPEEELLRPPPPPARPRPRSADDSPPRPAGGGAGRSGRRPSGQRSRPRSGGRSSGGKKAS